MLRRFPLTLSCLACLFMLLSRPADARLFDIFSVDLSDGETDIVLLDIPLFLGMEIHSRPGEEFDMTLLEIPYIFTLFRFERDEDSLYSNLVSLPFFAFYRVEKEEDELELEVLDIPLIEFYRVEKNGPDKLDRQFLTLPFIGSLYRHTRDGDAHERTILFFFNFNHD